MAQNKAVDFHNLVAKALYDIKRARPVTCTSIAFLTIRVQEPDKDDWTKLVHAADLECQWKRHSEMVVGCIICGTPQHAWALRRRPIFGTWISHCGLH
jgi:hypothetical protein